MTTDSKTSIFLSEIQSHKRLFYISLPLCFALLTLVMFFVPKHYTSSFTISRETEKATEDHRALTLNMPSAYDLGIARTDNAVGPNGYLNILQSDAFLYHLLLQPVSTLDGQWQGTLGAYLHRNKKEALDISYDATTQWYSQQAVRYIHVLRKSIEAKINHETLYVTISCTMDDPRVATQVARLVDESLLATIDRYEQEKMQGILHQIQQRTQEAEAAYLKAKQENSDEQETLLEIANSFARQQVIYEAQMMHHPAYMTLSEPTVNYRPSGPSLWQIPLVATLLLALCLLIWVERKLIIAQL